MRCKQAWLVVAAAGALAVFTLTGQPASHSDAPLIKQDPQVNLTDVYAFIGLKGGQKVLNVIVQVRPFSEPGDGVMYDRFADDALYSIHVANPTTGATVLRYDFQFSSASTLIAPGLKNPNTIISYGLGTEAGPINDVGDARQNFTQTYKVTKTVAGAATVIAMDRLTPPPNVGKRTTPFYNDFTTGQAVSEATSFAGLDKYTQQTIFNLASGETTFAGPREDGFFADTPAIFDLLDPRILDNDGDFNDGLGQDDGGVDGFKGYNVLAYAMQIPVATLNGVLPGNTTVGVYASASRPRLTLRSITGPPQHTGPFVQVNRMGNPLFNETLVALKDKDNYNRASPTDNATKFKTYAEKPELAFLINFVYGDFLQMTFGRKLKESGRTDLAGIFIPDVLRVDITTGAVPVAGQAGFNRLSFIAGDTTTNAAGQSIPSGWPNGRRLGDDVVDIALIAIANAPGETPFIFLGDNAAANDQVYHQVFPYSATPHAGPANRKDPTP